jgi:hypothetical protein
MALANLNTADFIQGSGVSQTGNVIDVTGGGGGVQSVTGDGVDNTDPDNPVLSFPTPGDIGALATGTAWLLASGGTLTANNTITFGSNTLTFQNTGTSKVVFSDLGTLTFTNNRTPTPDTVSLGVISNGGGFYAQTLMQTPQVRLADSSSVSTTGSRIAANGNLMQFLVRNVATSLAIFEFATHTASLDFTAGNGKGTIQANSTYTDTSGAGGIRRNIWSTPTINITGGTGVMYGFRYEPTLTSTTGLTNIAYGHTSGFVQWDSVLSPAQITSNQNNYNPTGFNNGGAPNGASILRLQSDATRDITGLVGGVDGRLLIISNVGSNIIRLMDEDAGSAAANRFTIGTTLSLTGTGNKSVMLWYDGTSQRWRTTFN